MAGIVDQHIVGQRRLAYGGARLAIDAELACLPNDLSFLAVDFILDGVLEVEFGLLVVVFVDVAKDFDQRLEQIRLATAILADEHIAKARAVETQCEVLQILVVADEYGFQAHDCSLTSEPSRHRVIQFACWSRRRFAALVHRKPPSGG